MHRIIAGATGLIGKRLVGHWLNAGQKLIVVGRSKARIERVFSSRVTAITWDELSSEIVQSAGIIVNLAGANIADKRWTGARKQEILSSRVKTTEKIVKILAPLGEGAPPLFNASAIGIYGLQQQVANGLPKAFDEDSEIDWYHPTDFLSHVARDWELTVMPAVERGVRVIFLRFGVVLAAEGGALPQLLKPFRFYVGGIVGTGAQPFSWVAIEDVLRAIDFLAAKQNLKGPFNIVAPQCVSQRILAETIGKVMHRPAKLTTPTFALELLLGKEMTKELLLEGIHVDPKRLIDSGFHFQFPNIEALLRHVVRVESIEKSF